MHDKKLSILLVNLLILRSDQSPDCLLTGRTGPSLPNLEFPIFDLRVRPSYSSSFITKAERAIFLAFFSVKAYPMHKKVPANTNARRAITINTTCVTKFISVV